MFGFILILRSCAIVKYNKFRKINVIFFFCKGNFFFKNFNIIYNIILLIATARSNLQLHFQTYTKTKPRFSLNNQHKFLHEEKLITPQSKSNAFNRSSVLIYSKTCTARKKFKTADAATEMKVPTTTLIILGSSKLKTRLTALIADCTTPFQFNSALFGETLD